MQAFNATASDRLWARVAVGAPDDCWPWTGPLNRDGYGAGYAPTTSVMMCPHRAAYLLSFGEIGDGLQVDHECHNRDSSCTGGRTCVHRRCCNPAHMAAKTNRENGLASHRHNGNRTNCVRGHAFDEANTRIDRHGHRWCRACSRENSANYKARKRGAS